MNPAILGDFMKMQAALQSFFSSLSGLLQFLNWSNQKSTAELVASIQHCSSIYSALKQHSPSIKKTFNQHKSTIHSALISTLLFSTGVNLPNAAEPQVVLSSESENEDEEEEDEEGPKEKRKKTEDEGEGSREEGSPDAKEIEKPFPCPECPKRYNSKTNMTRHCKAAHGNAADQGKDFKCGACPYQSHYAGDVKRHKAKHCPKRFDKESTSKGAK